MRRLHSTWIGSAALLVAALCGSAVATLSARACPPTYDIEIACAPPCGQFVSGATSLAMNDLGDIVGFATGLCFGERAFLWPAGASSIEFLPMPTGTYQSRAYGINNKGQIVGTYAKTGNATKGFMIDSGVFFDMGTLRGGNWSEAYGVNDAGLAVGFWGNNVTGPGRVAMHWQVEVMTDLTPFLEQPSSEALAVNESGVITGWLSPKNFHYDGRAFLWDGKNLTVLPPAPDAYTSFGRAINELGQVAGWGNAPCDPPQPSCIHRKGFFWNGREMIALGSLPGYPSVRPYGLNDAGQIVGYMEEWNNSRAFLWESGGLYVLDDLVDFGMAKFSIGYAYAINSKGQIAGRGNGTTGSCAVRLTPRPRRAADLDCDGAVGLSDLMVLLEAWGLTESTADLNGSGLVDGADLGILLADWGG